MLRKKIPTKVEVENRPGALLRIKQDVKKETNVSRPALGELGNRVGLLRNPNQKKLVNLDPKLPKPVKPTLDKKPNVPDVSRSKLLAKPQHNVSKAANGKQPEKPKNTGHVLNEKEKKVPDEKPLKIFEHKFRTISPVKKVDEFDKDDPFMVSDYVQDIYNYLRKLESKFPISKDFLSQHGSTPKMRTILVNWMVDVLLSFKFLPETLYLSVSIVDQYLNKNKGVGRSNLQLVGATAMFLASKYEEVVIANVGDYKYICDDHYSKQDILNMEKEIVRKLEFRITFPLAIQFYRRFSKVGNISPSAYALGKYLLELTLLDHNMSPIHASLKAAAAYCLATSIMAEVRDPAATWSDTLQYYSSYKYSDLKAVIVSLAVLLKRAPELKQQTIQEKYAAGKFFSISQNAILQGPLVTKLVHEAMITLKK